MVLFSRSFVRKRMISLATTASVAATSFALAQDPSRAFHVRGAMPIQTVADRPHRSEERPFLSENDAAYRSYLQLVGHALVKTADRAGVAVEKLPTLVGRPDSSPPKLIDEYLWMRITRGVTRDPSLRPTS